MCTITTIFHETPSIYGALYRSLGRIVNLSMIHRSQFFMIRLPWLSFPQFNQNSRAATIVAAIASTQLSGMKFTVHVSLADLAQALNHQIVVFCLGAVATFTIRFTNDVKNSLPASSLSTNASNIYRVPPNVRFEIDDVEARWTYNHKFDYIHCRFMGNAIRNWDQLVDQCFE